MSGSLPLPASEPMVPANWPWHGFTGDDFSSWRHEKFSEDNQCLLCCWYWQCSWQHVTCGPLSCLSRVINVMWKWDSGHSWVLGASQWTWVDSLMSGPGQTSRLHPGELTPSTKKRSWHDKKWMIRILIRQTRIRIQKPLSKETKYHCVLGVSVETQGWREGSTGSGLLCQSGPALGS